MSECLHWTGDEADFWRDDLIGHPYIGPDTTVYSALMPQAQAALTK